MRPEYKETDTSSWCDYCERETQDVMQDHGIGSYEYWGAKGVHHEWVKGCAECGEIK